MTLRHSLSAIGLAAISAALVIGSADASTLRCKSDPAVLLSDGTEVDLSADIGAALWDVTDVYYTLHVPAGLTVVAVLTTPNWPTTLERFTILGDNEPGRYDSATVVTTKKNKVGVTAQLIVQTAFASVSGKSGQTLRLQTTVADLITP